MTNDRILIIVSRNLRAVRKYIRGYAAESTDSELLDPLGVAQPAAVTIDGGVWQRPRVSADGMLCVWGVWYSQVSPATISRLVRGAVANPNLLRIYDGDEDRRTLVGWTDPPGP